MENVQYKNLYEDRNALYQNDYAGFGVRFVAIFIDGVILSFAFNNTSNSLNTLIINYLIRRQAK